MTARQAKLNYSPVNWTGEDLQLPQKSVRKENRLRLENAVVIPSASSHQMNEKLFPFSWK